MSSFRSYVDGSCHPNPGGPGGWGAVIYEREAGFLRELSRGADSTTNNRMELWSTND